MLLERHVACQWCDSRAQLGVGEVLSYVATSAKHAARLGDCPAVTSLAIEVWLVGRLPVGAACICASGSICYNHCVERHSCDSVLCCNLNDTHRGTKGR